jgi:hypothetical protein
MIFHAFIAPLMLLAQLLLPGVGTLFENIGDESTEEDSESMGEGVVAPDAVLTRQLGDTAGKKWYQGTGFKPNWLLEVSPRTGAELQYDVDSDFRKLQVTRRQVEPWPPRYTALSYSTSCVEKICEAANLKLPQKLGRKYSPADHRRISKELLRLYCSTRKDDLLKKGEDPDVVEYIWLDEFCISDAALDDNSDAKTIKGQRDAELARMADIYRYAANVTVFCSKIGCDHTDHECAWGGRLWTIAEILNAQEVVRMTVKREHDAAPFTAQLFSEKAHVFREAMQAKAAEREKWHLYVQIIPCCALDTQLLLQVRNFSAIGPRGGSLSPDGDPRACGRSYPA